jgi:hypothetical protein
MGVDLGQQSDFTAIVVDQVGEGDTHTIRHIERPRLKTKYPKIVKRVAYIKEKLKGRGNVDVQIYVDATGVGRPICDAFADKGIDVHPVTIVAGSGVSKGEEGWYPELHIGKLALVSRLNLLLSDGRLTWNGRTPLGKKLTNELHRFQVKATNAGNATFEAERGFHDDLVIALALAVWERKIMAVKVYDIAPYLDGTVSEGMLFE